MAAGPFVEVISATLSGATVEGLRAFRIDAAGGPVRLAIGDGAQTPYRGSVQVAFTCVFEQDADANTHVTATAGAALIVTYRGAGGANRVVTINGAMFGPYSSDIPTRNDTGLVGSNTCSGVGTVTADMSVSSAVLFSDAA